MGDVKCGYSVLWSGYILSFKTLCNTIMAYFLLQILWYFLWYSVTKNVTKCYQKCYFMLPKVLQKWPLGRFIGEAGSSFLAFLYSSYFMNHCYNVNKMVRLAHLFIVHAWYRSTFPYEVVFLIMHNLLHITDVDYNVP